MSAKAEILARIRAARPDVPAGTSPDPALIPRDYRRARDVPAGLVERFRERVADYRAGVEVVPPDAVSAAVAAALAGFGARRVAFAEGLPAAWRPDPGAGLEADLEVGLEVVADRADAPLGVDGLQGLDAVVTGAAVGIAETGTVVLDGSPACGRRALTLVPDAHVCLVAEADLVDDVPAAVARLRPGRPFTWISGPSATSDIELSRVEGVHGPRRLHVIVVQGYRTG